MDKLSIFTGRVFETPRRKVASMGDQVVKSSNFRPGSLSPVSALSCFVARRLRPRQKMSDLNHGELPCLEGIVTLDITQVTVGAQPSAVAVRQ